MLRAASYIRVVIFNIFVHFVSMLSFGSGFEALDLLLGNARTVYYTLITVFKWELCLLFFYLLRVCPLAAAGIVCFLPSFLSTFLVATSTV